jgi:hypothetical protein
MGLCGYVVLYMWVYVGLDVLYHYYYGAIVMWGYTVWGYIDMWGYIYGAHIMGLFLVLFEECLQALTLR